jgi:hypothetical protein
MSDFSWKGKRKRRTRSHVIEDMSFNFLEYKVLQRNHMLARSTQREYGWDATLYHFASSGEIENGQVRIQLKATDRIDETKSHVSCRVSTKDLHYWYWEEQQIPFVLVLYEATRQRAFWISVRQHMEYLGIDLDPEQQTVDLRLPWANRVNVRTIDLMREMSLARYRRED